MELAFLFLQLFQLSYIFSGKFPSNIRRKKDCKTATLQRKFKTQKVFFSSVQFISVAQLFPTLCKPMNHSTPGLPSITNSWSPPKPMSIVSVMPSDHIILCCPLLLWPSILPSIRVFSNELNLCTRWPKYWSFSFNSSPSNEHPGLISFRIDWLDFLEVQGTLNSLLQYHSSTPSILVRSAFFTVQLSYLYMTTGKNSLD